MRKDTTKRQKGQVTKGEVIPLPVSAQDWANIFTEGARKQVRDFIEELLQEEVTAIIGAGRYARIGSRQGYRNGCRTRDLMTSQGMISLGVPRARIASAGEEAEWRSQILPRYQRRARDVDATILSSYLNGVSTRQVSRALQPLLRGGPLTRSSVSRLVGRLREDFRSWQSRSLADEDMVYLYLDGWYVKIRVAGRVQTVPILVVMGVRRTGEKVLVAMEQVGSEDKETWHGVLSGLVAHGLRAPGLVVIDGNPGLRQALNGVWPGVPVQRCVVHKLRNLVSKVPRGLREELKSDYRRMVYAETREDAVQERSRFLAKWRKRVPAVGASLEEAGQDLFSFFKFPRAQWKSLRSTNPVERLHLEFRRRVKVQGAWSHPDVLVLVWAMVASGSIRMRKIDGWGSLSVAPSTPTASVSTSEGVLPKAA